MKRFRFTLLAIFIILVLYLFRNKSGEHQKIKNSQPTTTIDTTNKIGKRDLQIKPVNIKNQSTDTQKKSENTVKKDMKPNPELLYSATWKDLHITPLNTPEGIHYTFSAFDYHKGKFLFATHFAGKNTLKILNNKDTKIIHFQGIPLDLLATDQVIYLLTIKALYKIDWNGKISKTYPINDPNIVYFDKLLIFDQIPQILMSDGTSYEITNNNLRKNKGLLTNKGTYLNLIKRYKYSFFIDENPCKNYCKRYHTKKEIGSLTFSGGNYKNLFITIDLVDANGKYSRKLRYSKDSFKKDLLNLPYNKYTFVKNDFKIKNNKILILKADVKGIQIIQKLLK